ncbi:MAG: biopolymer transporter ExbD [Bacteroidetes bacterium]|nr:biopolymer transporter ExbD [Bacteroidota bacterium]
MADVGTNESRRHAKGRRRVRRVGVRIDMTPMVDVAFLLLTFFMLTTAFRRPQTMEISIPEENDQQRQVRVEESNILQIRVNRENTVFWNMGLNSPSKTDVHSLQQVFHDRSARNIDAGTGKAIKERYRLIVLIKIDERAAYENMIDIIDELDMAITTLNRQYGLSNAEKLTPRFAFAPYTEKDDAEISTAL